jgi:putative glutamine amidotransferase
VPTHVSDLHRSVPATGGTRKAESGDAMTAPRIGLTARSPRALAPYRRGIELGGGQPVVLDPWTPRPELHRLYESLDGILLPGGAGIAWIWRRHHRRTGVASPRPAGWSELESADVHLARWAVADDRPILGICRGIQMLALAVEGHLDREVPGHRLKGVYPAHQMELARGSRLREVLGASSMPVNSRHYRAVRSIPAISGFRATAWAAQDGVVEGIECTARTFAVGVQFHPEGLLDFDEPSRRLFREFVAACRERRGE